MSATNNNTITQSGSIECHLFVQIWVCLHMGGESGLLAHGGSAWSTMGGLFGTIPLGTDDSSKHVEDPCQSHLVHGCYPACVEEDSLG